MDKLRFYEQQIEIYTKAMVKAVRKSPYLWAIKQYEEEIKRLR